MAKDANLTSQEWCDIVFEEKNKKYGAYKIRRGSSKRHLIALLVVLGLAIFLAFLPILIKTVAEATRKPIAEGLVGSAELKNVEDEPDQTKEDQIANTQDELPPPPLKSTIKFTAPEIVSREEIDDENRIQSQDALASTTTQISTFTHVGSDDEDAIDTADLVKSREIVNNDDADKIEPVHAVEVMPEFPGGEGAMMEFIQKNIVYPQIARQNGIEGSVYVQFVVNSRGNIDRIKILKSMHKSLSDEAIRVVKTMPKWIPGKQNGHAVPTYVNLPIVFKLN